MFDDPDGIEPLVNLRDQSYNMGRREGFEKRDRSLTMVQPRMNTRSLALLSAILVFGFLALDYVTGPLLQFPVLLLIPVALVAWLGKRGWALALALVLPLPRIYFRVLWNLPADALIVSLNTLSRLIVFVFVALVVSELAREKRALEREITVLHGILPICMFCKKIRNGDGAWEQLEVYVAQRTKATFSHGMCKECAKQHYPEEFPD